MKKEAIGGLFSVLYTALMILVSLFQTVLFRHWLQP